MFRFRSSSASRAPAPAERVFGFGTESVPQVIGNVHDDGSPVMVGTTDGGASWSKATFAIPSDAPNYFGSGLSRHRRHQLPGNLRLSGAWRRRPERSLHTHLPLRRERSFIVERLSVWPKLEMRGPAIALLFSGELGECPLSPVRGRRGRAFRPRLGGVVSRPRAGEVGHPRNFPVYRHLAEPQSQAIPRAKCCTLG